MSAEASTLEFTALPGAVAVATANVDADQWLDVAQSQRQAGGRLVALWAEPEAVQGGKAIVCAAYAPPAAPGDAVLHCAVLATDNGRYPDINGLFACAGRMQRAAHDLAGLVADGADPVVDRRPWLAHGAWPDDYVPLRDAAAPLPATTALRDYPFVRVTGDGVHEIPVGPVHAGIIEPGHFRFSIVGEKVLRLEQRLGYKHKGIEQRFTQLSPHDAVRLAGRVSGDTTVGFAWAYAMALEAIAGVVPPPRAASLRALLLERERIANHLGDLGALGNDAAFAFGLTHFMRLKEDWLRLNQQVFGHRFGMDAVVPGGVMADLSPAHAGLLLAQCDAIERGVQTLWRVYESHPGLQDRFVSTGRVSLDLARTLGLTGMAGRASGMHDDLRRDARWAPYDQLGVQMQSQPGGDVAARVLVRFGEITESLRLIRALLDRLPAGPYRVDLPVPAAGFGIGRVEGWRGEVLVALRLDAGRIVRCHCHDPSWQNWPVLEHAVIGNIVPDFPLINKSFNLSYAGADL